MDIGDPFSCSSRRRGGAPREAQCPRRAAPKLQGPRFPPIPRPGQGRFALWGLLGPQPRPYRMSAPSQFQP
eukprot:12512194-Alexandrium_andersonii.AAC.1